MKTNWFKRTLCSILAFVMVLGYVPATAFASEADGLCEHHTRHTTDCGYSPAVEGHECGHAHTEECYQSVTKCVHVHGDCGYVPAVEGQSCDCQPDENGEIVHTEGCGYVEAVAEVLCGHVCSEETGCVTKELNCQHQHDTACGYVEEAVGSPCTFVCQECMSTTNESDSSEYNEDELPVGTGVTWALRGVEQYSSDYLEQCTDNHPTYARVKAIEQTPAYSLPCNPDTNSESVKQATYPIGEILTVTRYLCNTQGNYWLQLEDENWIYAKHVSIVEFCNPFTFADVALEKTEFREGQSNSIRGTLTVDGGADMEVDVKAWYSPVTGSESAKLLCSISGTSQSYDLPTVLPEKVGFDSIPEGQYKFHVSAETERFCPTGFPSDTWNGSSNQDGDWYWHWEKIALSSEQIQFTVESMGILWSLDNDGTLVISGKGDMSATGADPWDDKRDQIRSVVVKEGVTSICGFRDCPNLSNVSIADSVVSITANAFIGCANLKTLTLPEGLESIGGMAFYQCGIESITIPQNVKQIDDFAFTDCEDLREYNVSPYNHYYSSLNGVLFNKDRSTLLKFPIPITGTYSTPLGVTTLAPESFLGSNLTSVIISSSVSELSGAFGAMFNLSAFHVDSNNRYYTAIDGVLYSRDKRTIVRAPGSLSGHYSIPNSVTVIGQGAFSLCVKLKSVTIPESVETVEGWAFNGCAIRYYDIPKGVKRIEKCAFQGGILQSISLPSSLEYLDQSAFNCADHLRNVYYAGTETQWRQLESGWDNEWESSSHECIDKANKYFQHSFSWNLDDSGMLTLLGNGPAIDFGLGNSPWFEQSNTITKIYISPGITTIEEYAFANCINLSQITIPQSVSIIKQKALISTYKLDVFYHGSEEQWKSITIEDGNDCLSRSNIHYMDLSLVQPEPKDYTGEFQYPSAFLTKDTGTVIASYPYRFGDDWLESDSTQYDHAIARAAIRFAMAGYGVPLTGYSTNISKLLYELEFKNIQSEYPYPGPDTIGYIIGSKRVQFDDGIKTIVVVVVRGGGYRYEWASNFTVGTGDEHQGFSEAASTVYDGLLAYFEKNNILPDSNVKVLVTGYSRAAATTNLVAARIDDAIANNTLSLAKQNVFAYCFECPQTTRSTSSQSSRYQNIHCIVNDVDLVTKVAPSGWKYSRYGKTYHLPSAEYYGADYLPAKERMINQYRDILNEANAPYSDEELLNTVNEISGQGAFLDSYLGKLCRYISFPTIFSQVPYITDDYQSVLRAVGATMGETEGEKSWLTGLSIAVEAIVGLPKLAPFAALHPIDTAKIASSAYLGCIGGAHYAELCLAWMDAISGDMLKESVTSYRMRVNCPVDIEVYDSSNVLVAKIVNDEVIDVGGYIGAYIDEDGQKVIILPGNDTFDVRYLATDNGTMSCQVEEHDADGGTIELTNFYDIPIAKNDILSGTVSPEQGISIEDPEQNEIQPDQILSDNQIEYYSVSVSANGPGEVIGGGVITVGQFVKVTANPNEGAQFVKWCDESGETLSTDAVFRLCVTRDTNLVAVFAAGTENRNRIDNIDSIVGESPQVWIDGVCYPVQSDTTGKYVTIHDDAHTMVTYSYNNPNATDVHTKYPTGMKVWKLKQENGVYTAEYVPEFDNLLQYSGSSIRITGNKGIRMITSVNQDTRNKLTGNGLAGFKLLEYGTLLAQTSKLGDNPLVLGGGEYVKSNYAYKKGVADPVFKYTNGLIQYTNVLIGFTDEQCKEDIAMRPYMKLLDENGEEVVIYGGIVYRSIGYIAYQNRNAFQPRSAAYEYVWGIIHNVYGNQYDNEYKK